MRYQQLQAQSIYLWKTSPVAVVLGTLFIQLISITTLYVVYNLYFHPLAAYPGPKWSAATHIPRVRALLSGRLPWYCHNLHLQYGDVVRIAPNELSYRSAESWKEIYGHRSGKGQLRKDPDFYTAPPGGIHSIITADTVQHARIRRLVSHAFSDKALREQEPLMKGHVSLLMCRLHESAALNNPVDIVGRLNWVTFDVIGDLTFGEGFDCLQSSHDHPWIEIMFQSIKAASWFSAASIFPGAKWILPMFMPKGLMETRTYHQDMTATKVHKRLERKTDRNDFMKYILRYNDDRGMSVPEINSTANALINAGAETTATLLSGAIFHLLRNPKAMQLLTEEIRGAFKTEDEISIESASRLKYMLAVLDETLRMYPPVPTGLPRVIPKGGDVICGKFVPEWSIVSVNHWSTYHTSTNFALPSSFIPERFLGDLRFASDNRDALQPFSVGSRNCIGKNLAYAEMRLILARIVWNFDMELVENSDDWIHHNAWTLYDKPPLYINLKSVRD